ncbi:HlyD family secretion protein [Geobacillus sp. C56-T2]|uniref:HlyD family secretion protein n=1 Tax=Geobacillus sp. C56-T2 TaxID=600773 RepID=UPI0011A42E61|nr:efflux RND transporter periplasmic adaptor subunit [Geobacillus sp. C56-T2]NNV07482.1 HlyD family efflux transporter periplasmic adaptor subunit [Geobacillus sp. MMMUD3]TWG30458.1 Multidrug resistance efflux pump [Geobacillus sp. C56-T2]
MNVRRLLVFNIIVLILLVGGGFAAYYYINETTNYIKTDNARIDGQVISVAAPLSGKLTSWRGETGKTFSAGEEIGAVSDGKTTVPVTVPHRMTIAQQSAIKDSFVAAGTPLARGFDLNDLWVTANIEETDIEDVKAGQDVDIYVDAYPDRKFSGKVEKIGTATANTFSLLPSSNATGNYTKVTQVIPVTISIDNYSGAGLVPGMNVTVRIHK